MILFAFLPSLHPGSFAKFAPVEAGQAHRANFKRSALYFRFPGKRDEQAN